ncbi:MAG: polymerase [Acidobacteria bacterium]|nr:polymerase [Acidobacteriota bacterium]
MFACLFLPLPASAPEAIAGGLEAVAREVSPRVEVHRPGLVTLDAGGLDRLLGPPREIAAELQRACAARHLPASVAVAGTRTAAMLLAVTAPGVAVVPPGEERRRVSPLPLGALMRMVPPDGREGPLGRRQDVAAMLDLLQRWGLRTLGDLARLPEAALSARLGPAGTAWQRVARGEDLEPLVARPPESPIEETLDLDWPVEGLEPLSFALARVLEPIAGRLEQRDEAAVLLLMTFRLASREVVSRRIELPAPMRDPKVLRTLVLLHLESHPLGAGVDRLTIRVEPARAPVTQFSLLSRALPFPEQIATLVARLAALAGERCVGAPALVDSHRPGAFAMRAFRPSRAGVHAGHAHAGHEGVPASPEGGECSTGTPSLPRSGSARGETTSSAACRRKGGAPLRHPTRTSGASDAVSGSMCRDASNGPLAATGPPSCARLASSASVPLAIRRFRLPIAAHVMVKEGRPVRVTTERRGLRGGVVGEAAGPWRTSGEWWRRGGRNGERRTENGERTTEPFDRDEWDLALADGGLYRVFQDRGTGRWFVDGIID